MNEVECPICASATTLALGVRFCTLCRWNVLRARENLHRVKLFPIFWFVMTGVLFIVGISDKGVRGLVDGLSFTALFTGIGLWGWHRIRKARTIIDGHEGKVDSNALQAELLRQKKKWEWLLYLPPPREIRMTTTGRHHLGGNIRGVVVIDSLLALCVYGNWWVAHRQHGNLADRLVHPILVWCLVLGVLTTLFYSYLIISHHRKAHRLLVRGQVAMARIVKQELSNGHSVLVAEFIDCAGQTIKAKWWDRSRLYFEDMIVPLFYNPAQTKDTFVIFGDDDYEIVRPG